MLRELFYERKVELITCLCEWRYENKQLGLAVDISDSWTPEQRQQFLQDWQDDEPLLQVGCGQKRFIDEVNDGAGTSDDVSDTNFFYHDGCETS